MASYISTPRGALKVTAPLSFGISHMAPVVAGFLTLRVKIELDLADRSADLVAPRRSDRLPPRLASQRTRGSAMGRYRLPNRQTARSARQGRHGQRSPDRRPRTTRPAAAKA